MGLESRADLRPVNSSIFISGDEHQSTSMSTSFDVPSRFSFVLRSRDVYSASSSDSLGFQGGVDRSALNLCTKLILY